MYSHYQMLNQYSHSIAGISRGTKFNEWLHSYTTLHHRQITKHDIIQYNRYKRVLESIATQLHMNEAYNSWTLQCTVVHTQTHLSIMKQAHNKPSIFWILIFSHICGSFHISHLPIAKQWICAHQFVNVSPLWLIAY